MSLEGGLVWSDGLGAGLGEESGCTLSGGRSGGSEESEEKWENGTEVSVYCSRHTAEAVLASLYLFLKRIRRSHA